MYDKAMQNIPKLNILNNLIFFLINDLSESPPLIFFLNKKADILHFSSIFLAGILILSQRQYQCHDGLGEELIARTDGPGESPPRGM